MTLLRPLALLVAPIGAISLAAGLLAQAPAPAPAAAAPTGLPDGPEKATLVRVCSACHEAEAVTTKRLTPEGWHDLVEQMAANGAVATDAELAQITTYLARNFPG